MRFEVVRLNNVGYTQMQMSGNKVWQPLGRSGAWPSGRLGVLKSLFMLFYGRGQITQIREGVALACTYDQAY